MLDIGFSELLLVVVAAILFIGPKDYPVVIRAVAKAMREIKALTQGLKAQANELMRESGLEEFSSTTTRTITDLEGKSQIAYDVAELDTLRGKDEA